MLTIIILQPRVIKRWMSVKISSFSWNLWGGIPNGYEAWKLVFISKLQKMKNKNKMLDKQAGCSWLLVVLRKSSRWGLNWPRVWSKQRHHSLADLTLWLHLPLCSLLRHTTKRCCICLSRLGRETLEMLGTWVEKHKELPCAVFVEMLGSTGGYFLLATEAKP